MAEVNGPTDESPTGEGRRNADLPADAPTGSDEERVVAPATEGTDRAAAVPVRHDEPGDATDARAERPAEAVAAGARGTEEPTAGPRGTEASTTQQPAATQPVAPPAHDQAEVTTDDVPPQKSGNRLVGTAWVLLAAGLFEVLFFAVNAFVALVFGGAGAVVPQLRSVGGTALAWLPVLLFFLLFELTVLIVNRGTRLAYVLASLIVAIVVYVLTVLLFSLIVRHTVGDVNTLAQTFLNWEFILVGLVAREVMLWTGLAIGSRGTRVRRRYRDERRRYDEQRTAA